MLKEITVSVSKETHEVGVVVGNLLKAIKDKKAVADIVSSELAAVFTAVEGVEKAPAEAKENLLASVNAIQLPVTEGIVYLLAGKPEAPASA